MLELWAVVIQFLLTAFFITDKDIRRYAVATAVVLSINNLLVGVGDYYLRNMIFDLLFMSTVITLKDSIKQYLLFAICACSLLMNYYEWQSVYQTFIYEYRDIVQWWMVELMFVITFWKCSWRGNFYVKNS